MRGDEFFRQFAREKPFSKLHPQVAAFFKDYLAREKVMPFQGRFVLNTHFPPYPSPAFDQLAENFSRIGDADQRRLHSVTLAVTNRCDYRCWHCYNADRSQQDLPLATLREVAGQLQDLGAVMVTLSGGEPLLREDLEEIASSFDPRTCLTLNTTGAGFSAERARALRDSGVFAVGVSLDALQPEEHDRRRGKKGAFQTALAALRVAGANGLYPYIQIHGDYDEFWLREAGKPVADLVGRLSVAGKKRVLEAGCGTGFATVMLAAQLDPGAYLTAVDLSEGMLAEARKRARSSGLENIQFAVGDALALLDSKGPWDLIFTSWVLGYIPLRPFFAAAGRALERHGQLALVVHKENSPREPLEIFGELVAQDPSVLQKRVAFDFPRDLDQVRAEVEVAGLEVEHLWEGAAIFLYETAEQVLEHLLKSGAGTAFYEAIDPRRRQSLEQRFLQILASRRKPGQQFEVVHDCVSCIARKA